MNPNFKKAALIISIVFALSGCGTANTPATGASAQNLDNQPAQGDQNVQTPPDGQGSQNNRSRLFEAADLIGEVSSISGNEITVKVVNFQGMGQGRRGGAGINPDGQTSPGAFNRRQVPAGDGQTPGNDPGQSQTRGNDPEQSQAPGNDQSGGRQQRSIQYTGETKVLKIPDDIIISQTVRGDSGITSQAIQISEIKAGDILQVYYSDKTKETISKITLGSGMGMGGGRPQEQ